VCPGKRKGATTVRTKPSKKPKLDTTTANPLDATWIHPESYELADRWVVSEAFVQGYQ